MSFSYPHPPSGYSPYLKGRVCGVELFGWISLFRNSSPKIGEVAAEPPEEYYWPFRHPPLSAWPTDADFRTHLECSWNLYSPALLLNVIDIVVERNGTLTIWTDRRHTHGLKKVKEQLYCLLHNQDIQSLPQIWYLRVIWKLSCHKWLWHTIQTV